jgi:hypothetical protein
MTFRALVAHERVAPGRRNERNLQPLDSAGVRRP